MRTRKLLSQTAIYMAGLGLSRGMGLLLVPLYTRQLSQAAFFTWDICTTTVLFVLAVAELGMSSSLARFYVHADTDEDRRAFAQTSTTIAFASASAVALALLLFRHPIAPAVFGTLNQPFLLELVIANAAAAVAANLPLALLRAQERAVAFAALCFARAIVGPVFIILFVVKFDLGVRGILAGDTIGIAAQAAIGLALCRADLLPVFHGRAARTLLSFGIPIIPIGIANTIVIVSDRYFLREWVAPSEAAVFTLGFKIATVVNLVTMALQTAWAPTAFRIAKLDNAPRLLADTFRILAVGLGMLGLATSLCAPELARVFAPAGSYAGASRIVPWIAFSYALQAAVLMMNTNLIIANKTILSTAVFCTGAVAKLLLAAALIPHFGITGAAAATLVAFLIEILLTAGLGSRVYPVPYDARRFAALAAILALASWALSWTHSMSPGPSALARMFIFTGAAMAIVACGIVRKQEIRRMTGVFGARDV